MMSLDICHLQKWKQKVANKSHRNCNFKIKSHRCSLCLFRLLAKEAPVARSGAIGLGFMGLKSTNQYMFTINLPGMAYMRPAFPSGSSAL